MASGYPDYEGGKQKVYLVPEWAAKEGADVYFNWGGLNVGEGLSASLTHDVPADKTLYITQLSFYSRAFAVENADLNQICMASIGDSGDVENTWQQGGNGGGAAIFHKPMVIHGGNTATFAVYNYSNHHCNCGLTVSGYEV
jgi:hypothetical protein